MWPQLALWALTGNCVKALHVSHLLEQKMMTELPLALQMPTQVSDPLLSFHPTSFNTGIGPTEATLTLSLP